ncbi:MAG: hypothetical protein IJV92_00260 [Phascolarctobacterium sp.]|nr:hypothetical protein [Phascolarctobacterium sp.]
MRNNDFDLKNLAARNLSFLETQRLARNLNSIEYNRRMQKQHPLPIGLMIFLMAIPFIYFIISILSYDNIFNINGIASSIYDFFTRIF